MVSIAQEIGSRDVLLVPGPFDMRENPLFPTPICFKLTLKIPSKSFLKTLKEELMFASLCM